ncbi:MAG: hypothetical protein R3Y21_03150 [Mycoplasmatota bacterium]
MKNKILVNVYVPQLLSEYNVYIPVNERICKIKELFIKSVFELSDSSFDLTVNHSIIESETGNIYSNETIIRETTIKNGSKLILF